jgi:hypothetical protein
MCITPITLQRNYKSLNKSDINHFTNVVPCGKCFQCLSRRSEHWAFRIENEMKECYSVVFLTLTYEEQPLSNNGYPTLVKKDFQNFMKRLRKRMPQSNPKLKYYACGEYGTQTQRPHYHAIMFNLPQSYIQRENKIRETWNNGNIDLRPCNIARIKYVTKYITKGFWKKHKDKIDYETGEIIVDDRIPEFSLMSKNLGLNYLKKNVVKNHKDNLQGHVVRAGGIIQSLPRYYRDKLFNRQEKKVIAEAFLLNRKEKFKSHKLEVQWKKQKIKEVKLQNKLKRNQI